MPETSRPQFSVCHLEIPAPDLEVATKFYTDVFGWRIHRDTDGMEYAFWDDGGIGGGFDPKMTPQENGANLVITVEDICSMLDKIESHGGKTTKPRTEIGGGHGYFAEFLDPLGNRLGLWTKT